MPILRHELTLIARRNYLALWRGAFALALAAVGGSIYVGAAQDAKRFGPKEIADVTQYVALALFATLFMIGVAVTPQWTADAVAGEKERQTLPFLLLTPLSSRSIILGKLGSRLVQVGAFLLAGLPILVAIVFFGGVDPALILLAMAVLAATLTTSACVTVVASVFQSTTKAAAQRAGQAVAAYIFGMMMVGQALRAWPQIATFPGPGWSFNVHDLYDWINVGNPIVAGRWVVEELAKTGSAVDALLPIVRNYVAFHLLVSAACVAWAVRRLRSVAADPTSTAPAKAVSRWKRPVGRPPVSDHRPVTWKMVHCDLRMAKTNLNLVITRLVFILSFMPVMLTIFMVLYFGNASELPTAVNAVLRGVMTVGLCISLAHIGGQAATSLPRERVKQTLDELLLTDLTTREILGQKWLGAVVTVKWMMVWAGLHWAIGIVTGGLHPLAVPLLIVLWCVNAAMVASLGTYCGVVCDTVKGANTWMALLGVAIGFGPLFVALIGLMIARDPAPVLLVPTMMTPLAAFAIGTFGWAEWTAANGRPDVVGYVVMGTLVGLVLNAVLAVVWWRAALRRFPQTIGRAM